MTAWSVPQSASNTTAVGATTIAVTYGSNVSAGSVLLAYVSYFANNNAAATIASVKDGAGNSFTQIGIQTLNNSAAKGTLSAWALPVPAGDAGTAPTITATINSPGHSGGSIVVQEVTGILAVTDGTAGTAFATSSASISPSYSSTATGEYLVAVFGDNGGPETATQSGSGYTTDAHSVNNTINSDVVVAYKASTGGAESGGWSLTGTVTASEGAILVALKLPPPLPPPPPVIGPDPFSVPAFASVFTRIPRNPPVADVFDSDAGAGADTGSVTAALSDSDAGAAADAGSVVALALPPQVPALTPPAYYPGVTSLVTRPISTANPVIPPGTPVSGSDTGTGADAAASIALSDSDTGAGADTAASIGVPDSDAGAGADTAASIGVAGGDTGSGADTGSQFASIPLPPPPPVIGPDPFSVPAFASAPQPFSLAGPPPTTPSDGDTGTGADTGSVTASLSDGDTGTGADTGTIGVSDADTGTGADTAASIGVAGADTGAGADTAASIALSAADTGTGADTATSIGVSDSDTGAGADTGVQYAAIPPPPPLLIPPGFTSPMNFTALPVLPVPAPASITGADTGTAAEAGSVAVTSFPQIPLNLTAELNLTGAAWSDITPYVYQRDSATPVTIHRGKPDEAAQVEPSRASFEVNNRDGRFTVRNPAGPWFGTLNRNTPVRFSVPATGNCLRLEGDNTSYVSTPDSAALSITGDIEVQIDLQPSGYLQARLAGKWNTSGVSQGSWILDLDNDGTVSFFWSSTGADTLGVASTVPLPLGRIALKATLAVATGTVTFWTAPSIGGAWTQLGAAASGTGGASTSVFDSTSPLFVGYDPDIAGSRVGLTGNLYAFKLLNGIGGTVVASPDFTSQGPGVTSFNDAQGNAWTLNGTAEISGRDYRFHGELSALPVTWDPSGTDVWTPVAAAGLLRRLGQGNAPLNSALTRGNLSLSGTLAPVAYWPCEDGQGATSLASGIGGPSMTVAGTPATAFAGDSQFACAKPLPTINSSSWYGIVPPYTSSGSIVVRFLLDVTSPPAASNKVYLAAITSGTAQRIAVYAGTGTFTNEFGLVAYNGSTVIFDTGSFVDASLPASPTPAYFSLQLTDGGGGTVNYALVHLTPGDGQVSGTILFSGSYSGTVGNCTAIQVNPGFASIPAGLGQITVQGDISDPNVLVQQVNAWRGETAGSRFARLCTENGIASRIYGAPAVTAAMGEQTPQTLVTLLQECEGADLGMIYEPRQVLGLGYRTQAALCSQAPAAALDYSAAETGGDGSALAPTYDDQYTRNDVSAQRTGGTAATSGAISRITLADGTAMSTGAPPGGVGPYATTASANVHLDAQLPDVAGWLVHLGTVNEQRWPQIPVNMARPAVAAVRAAVQACTIGDYLEVTNPPAWLPPDPVRQLVAGYSEVLGGYHWRIAFHCVPESPYEVAVYDDATYGRADTNGSTLASSASSGATSLSVASTGIVWTTAAADFPFDVSIGGERITVTNITGPAPMPTWTATGSLLQATASSFSITPAATGDLILMEVIQEDNSTVTCTGLSSSGVTWSLLASHAGATATGTCAVFAGQVTSTAAQTVTVSWSGTTPATIRIAGREFLASTGAWTLDASGVVDSAGTSSWATLAPSQAGDLYWGFCLDSGTASAGGTGGFTYGADSHGNGEAYNPACGSSPVTPAWGDSGQQLGLMVLMKQSWAGAAQSFTVTRSVNGVVKTHPSGEDVRLWFPPVYATF